MGCGLDGWGSVPSRGKIFLFHSVQTDARAHPASYSVDTGLSLGVKWLDLEADHLLPSGAEVVNDGAITSFHQNVFMAWCIIKIKHRKTLLYVL
jgi:hypothetical protein